MIGGFSHWWESRSASEKLLLGMACLLAVLIAGREWVVEPIQSWKARVRSEIAKQEFFLQSHERMIAKKDALGMASQAAREERAALNAWLLKGKTPALSAVELQEIVQGMAAKNGARITSTSVLPLEVRDGFQRISIKLSVEGDLPAITKLIQGLESHARRLMITNLDLRSSGLRGVRTAPRRDELRTTLTVVGIMGSEGSSAGKEDQLSSPGRGASL